MDAWWFQPMSQELSGSWFVDYMIHMKIVFFTGFSSYVLFVRPGVASAAEDCSVKAANQVGAYALRNNFFTINK